MTYNGKLDRNRVCLFTQSLSKGIVQSSNILEPRLILRVPQDQILGTIGTIFPVTHDLRRPSVLHNCLKSI